MATFFCNTCKRVSTSEKAGQVVSAQLAKKTLDKHGVRLTVGDRILRYELQTLRNSKGQRYKKRQCPYCNMSGLVEIRAGGGVNTGGGGITPSDKTDFRDATAQEEEKYSAQVSETHKLSERAANIQVGDLISELATAIRYRVKLGLPEGDFMEEPERAFTDGAVFGEEQTVASSVKFQLTLTLDCSASMWSRVSDMDDRIRMALAGPAFIAIDRMVRKALADLPDGTVKYSAFIFHDRAVRLPEAFVTSYVNEIDGTILIPSTPTIEQWRDASSKGQIPSDARIADYPLSGAGTRIAPLFKIIKTWEETEGNPDGIRLDIIITDGDLSASDVERASRTQIERNGRLRTVLLNFLPFEKWKETSTPDRCSQYAVTPDNLSNRIRDILSEAVQELLE